MASQPPAAPLRWWAVCLSIAGAVGGLSTVLGGAVVATGWPGKVNDKLDDHQHRLEKIEAGAPELIGLRKDVQFLVDRARREDDRRDREAR